MQWILTNIWISAPIAAILIGGLIIVVYRATRTQKKNYPTPRRKVVFERPNLQQTKPLLIRLPKLG
ncbi:MAG TPA: hypothetical protein PKJ63_06365 [Cyclobacteriaceae bacterium]|nr:hypothetical protein [Cyclobacteriaceae bacterium]HRW99211.1 hypothetical protein [Cyclobacteriaceae bacterium]